MAETRRLVFRIEDASAPEALKNVRAFRRELEKMKKAIPEKAQLDAFAGALNSIRQQAGLAAKGLSSTTDELKVLNRQAKATQSINDKIKGLGDEAAKTSSRVNDTTQSFRKLVGTEAAVEKLKQALAPGQSSDKLIKSLLELRNTSKDLPALAAKLRNAFNLDDSSADELAKSVGNIGKRGADATQTARQIQRAFKLDDSSVDDLTQSVKKLGNESQKVTKNARSFNSVLAGLSSGGAAAALNQVADLFRSVGRGVGSLIGNANKEFGSFDAALVEFSQKSGIAREDLGELGDEATRLATITSQTPASVAELSAALLALGTPAEQVQGNLSGIVKLADVIGEDPVMTGKVIQTGVNIFGKFGETSDTLSDKISKLINTTAAGSSGGVQEFFQLYQQAGPVAAEAGISFDELSTAFATLRDAGVSARVGATGLRNTILNLAAPSDKARAILEDLGVKVFEVGENGEETFVGLEEAVRRFGEGVSGLSEEEQIFAAERIFGKGNIAPVFALLSQLDSGFQKTAANVANSAGAVDEALEVINQGARRQAELFQGEVAAAFTSLGAAISPAGVALIQFNRDLLNAAKEGSSGLGELTGAGERLQSALAENPQVVQALGSALGQIADLITGAIVGGLDRLSTLINTVSDQDLANFTSGLVETAQSALALVTSIGDLLLGLGPLAGGFAAAGNDAFNVLAPAIAELIGFLGEVLSFLGPVTQNTALLSTALQVLAVRMIAIKGIALAGSFKALVVQLGAATAAAGGTGAAFTAMSAKAAAAIPPLAALAAAIAATKFIKHTRDLKVANDALEAYTNGTSATADAAFNTAQSIAGINQAIEEQGGEATDEQIRKLEGYRNLATEQIDDLKAQLDAVQSFEPQNEDQRRSQEGLVSQLNTTINALEGQIGKAETQLAGVAGGLGEETGQAFTDGIEETASGATDQLGEAAAELEAAKAELEEAFASGERDKSRAAEDEALERRAAQEEKLANLREQSEAEIAAIRERNESEIEARQEAHQERLAEIQEDVNATIEERERENQAALAEAEKQVAEEIADFEKAQQKELEGLQEDFQDSQEDKAETFQKRQQAATEAFQKSQQADAEAFEEKMAQKRKESDREFSALEREVDRRLQLEQASPEERDELEARFAEEDQTFQDRRRIEGQVLNQRGSIVGAARQEGRLEDSPLEAARAKEEAAFNAEEEKFQAAQQEQAKAFQEAQEAEAKAFQEAQEEERKTFEEEVMQPLKEELQDELDQRKAAAEEEILFPLRQRLEDELTEYRKELEDSQIKPIREQQEAELAELKKQNEAQLNELKKESEAEIQAAQKEFDENERQLARQAEDDKLQREKDHQAELKTLEDQAQADRQTAEQEHQDALSAQELETAEKHKAILESTRIPAPAGVPVEARRTGGDALPGNTYLGGEAGPELIRYGTGQEALIGVGGQQYFTPSKAGWVYSARQTEKLLQARYRTGQTGNGSSLGINLPSGEPSNSEIIRKLDALIKVSASNGPPRLSPVYNFPPSSDPYGQAAEASFANLRQMVKGAGL